MLNTVDNTVFRPMFVAAKKHFGNKPVMGVEIGTSEGVNAGVVLANWKEITKLWCVDSWLTYPEYTDYTLESDQTILRNACMINATKEPRMHIIINTSVEAAKGFEDKSVDFVYIDANHAYKYIKEDIDTWLPKIKEGGIIGGHDWDWTGPNEDDYCAVKRAVEDTFGKVIFSNKDNKVNYDIKVYVREEESESVAPGVDFNARLDSDWWVFL